MGRTVWIGILGFGLLLFVLLDLVLIWSLVASRSGPRGYGGIPVLILATWQAYIALKRRIDSKPKKQIAKHGLQD
jgi:hypothetical protein